MDCSRAGGSADNGFGPSPSQRKNVCHARESRSTADCWWSLLRELPRTDGLSPCCRVNAEAEHIDGHERFFARVSTAHFCSRTGLDGNGHVDGRNSTVLKEMLDGANGRTDADGWCHGDWKQIQFRC